MILLGYVRYGPIPDDVQIGHHGEERELAGIQKGKYSHKYDKDLQNLPPDHAEKAVARLAVVLALDRALEGISGIKSAEFSRRTTVWFRGSHTGTKRIGRFAKRAERNLQEHWYVRSDENRGWSGTEWIGQFAKRAERNRKEHRYIRLDENRRWSSLRTDIRPVPDVHSMSTCTQRKCTKEKVYGNAH